MVSTIQQKTKCMELEGLNSVHYIPMTAVWNCCYHEPFLWSS